MPKDIYHSPYNITRKGNTDIHMCTHEGTTYETEKTETETKVKVEGDTANGEE